MLIHGALEFSGITGGGGMDGSDEALVVLDFL